MIPYILKTILLTLIFMSIFMPLYVVCADEDKSPVDLNKTAKDKLGVPTSASGLLKGTLQWILGISGGVAILMIVYSGILFIVSGGSEIRKKAVSTLTYAIIGLVVVILSWTIIYLVTTIF